MNSMTEEISEFRRRQRAQAFSDRGGAANAVCDICGEANGTDYHEIISRGATMHHDEARELSFSKDVCAVLCSNCHLELASNPAMATTLLEKNSRRPKYKTQQVYLQLAEMIPLSIPLAPTIAWADVRMPEPTPAAAPLPQSKQEKPAPAPKAAKPVKGAKEPKPKAEKGIMTLDQAVAKAIKDMHIRHVTEYEQVPRIPSASLALDDATGGGIPRGRITTISGDAHWGKTSMCTLIAAGAVNAGGRVAFFDTEGTFIPDWAESLGLDVSMVDVFRGNGQAAGEQLLDAVLMFIQAQVYDVIIIDSIHSTLFRAEEEGGMDDMNIGRSALKWSIFARKAQVFLDRAPLSPNHQKTALVLTNKTSPVIGGAKGKPGMPIPLTEPGGKQVTELSPSLRIRLSKPFWIGEDEDDRILEEMHFGTIKNKMGAMRKKCHIKFKVTEEGFQRPDPVDEAIEVGRSRNVFTNAKGEPAGGGYWFFGELKLAVGEENVKGLLRESEELLALVREEIYRRMYSITANSPLEGKQHEMVEEESGDAEFSDA